MVEKDPVTATGIISQMGGLFPFVATVFGIFFTIKEDGKAKSGAKKKSDDTDGGDSDDGMLTSAGGLEDMMSLDGALKFGYKRILPALGHGFMSFFRSKKVQPAAVKPLTGGKPGGIKSQDTKPAAKAAEITPRESVPGAVPAESDGAAAPGKVEEIRNEIRKYGARETPLLDTDDS